MVYVLCWMSQIHTQKLSVGVGHGYMMSGL